MPPNPLAAQTSSDPVVLGKTIDTTVIPLLTPILGPKMAKEFSGEVKESLLGPAKGADQNPLPVKSLGSLLVEQTQTALPPTELTDNPLAGTVSLKDTLTKKATRWDAAVIANNPILYSSYVSLMYAGYEKGNRKNSIDIPI